MLIRVSAELPLSAETYLLERDGSAFRSFMAEEMSLQEYEIEECWKEGAATVIRLCSKPDVSAWIPGSLAKSIPDKFEYFDIVRYDPAKLAAPPYELSIRSEAPFLGDKGHFVSRTIIEPLGPNRCRHVLEQTIEMKGLFGLGGVAKKLAKKSLQDSFEEMPALMEKWVEVRQELLATPHGRARLLAGRPRVEGVAWMEELAAAVQQQSAAQTKQRRNAAGKHRRHERPSPKAVQLATEAAAAAHGKPGAGLEPAAAAAASVSVPLPSAFAAAAAQGSAMVGAQREGSLPAAAGGVADSAAAGQGSMYWDAAEARPTRQGTGATTYLTPEASLAPSASQGPPPPPTRSEPPGEAADAPAGAGGGAGRPGDVQVHRLGPPSGDSTPSDGELADRSSSGEADEEDAAQEWASSAPWRDYYHQHGLQPLRRDLSLDPRLVKRFIPKKRPQPVQARRLGGGSSDGGTGGRRRRSMWRMCGGDAAVD